MINMKYRAFFDKKIILWNDKDNAFYIAPSDGSACIVLIWDKMLEPHFIGEGRLESIMQFTGFIDVNGTDIYEGDIFGSEQLRCVVKRHENGEYFLSFIDKRIEDKSITNHVVKKSKIIGNVYENSELITNL